MSAHSDNEPGFNDGGELRVSTLELFFDLVFVFTLTQLTALLEHDVSLIGAVQVVLIFVVLFWMYGGYVWLTNQLPPMTAIRRILLIGGMAAFLVCAIAIPTAFDGGAIWFGFGYLLVVLVHSGLYVSGYGTTVWRFAPTNVVGALCVVAAAFVDRPAQYALWTAPIALQYLSSQLAQRVGSASAAGYDIRPAHFVERHGLLLLVAFGESVVAVGIGIGDVALDAGIVGVAVLGLVLAAALWWTYFGEDEDRAEGILVAAPIEVRLPMALHAYFYAYIPMLLGIVALAAGVHLTIADVGARLATGPALLLGGGVALYLGGDVAFRLALGIRPVALRAVAAGAALATMLLGIAFSGLAQLIVLLGVLIVMLAAERRR